jgi:hypothetical protein
MLNNPKNRSKVLLGLCALAISMTLSVATTSAQDTGAAQPQRTAVAKPAAKSGKPYFIEFRARSAHNYGHTFVVHGRVGQKITPKDVVGLHPAGDSAVPWLIGHLVPVKSDTGWSDGDIGYQDAYITARYRILLSEAEYKPLLAEMRRMQGSSPVWHAALYNCNKFVGDIANFMGLKAPFHWLMPKDFVEGIKEMNGGRRELSPSSHEERSQTTAAAPNRARPKPSAAGAAAPSQTSSAPAAPAINASYAAAQ